MRYFLSKHASERAQQMNLEPDEIAELLAHPHVALRCASRSNPDKLIWQLRRGSLTAFADKDSEGDWMVITFVPATEEAWKALYPDARDGREYRPELWKATR